MRKYGKEDIIRLVEEDGIEFIRTQFAGIFGRPKGVAIAASQVEKAANNRRSRPRATAHPVRLCRAPAVASTA